MVKSTPTAEQVRQLFHYNPHTGIFTRLTSENPKLKIGSVAGCRHASGYVHIGINQRYYKAHRLAWLYVTGNWPQKEIDHIDGDPSNNIFTNLRETTHLVNSQNQRRAHCRSKTKFLGVSRYYRKFKATVNVEGRRLYLGLFSTAEEAHAAYLAAKRLHHPGCTI